MSKYKSEWKPMEKNEQFWNEVLVGRKITEIIWENEGIRALVLDSGETVSLHKGPEGVPTLAIND